MSIAVKCPRCQATFPITNDLADGPVSCPTCANVFYQGAPNGIQAGLPKSSKPASDRENDELRRPSRPHASPRVPFPTVPLLILACGLLFLLLVLSAGFNFWVMVADRDALRAEHEARAMQMREAARAAEMRDQADQIAKQAAENQQRAQQEEAKLKRQLDDMRRELEAVRLQLDDAKRKLKEEK